MDKRWGFERLKLTGLLINLEVHRNSVQFTVKDVLNSILGETAFFLRYSLTHVYINSHTCIYKHTQNVMKRSKQSIQKKMD